MSKTAKEIMTLKNNVFLFSRLYVSALHRGGDIQDFFSHENRHRRHLSTNEQLRFETKSDLLECIDSTLQGLPSANFAREWHFFHHFRWPCSFAFTQPCYCCHI
eukprot:Pompholyxophrys_punicea_v1_NODE_93_length_3578_cov_92.823162.p4 type:complete len:104 gc:universal NODE_93_length_3578_cov_92.823162:1211-900(-)